MLRRTFSLVCGVLLISLLAFGQVPTSTLNGTVTDPQGAVVTSATVTATQTGTGVTRTANTNAQGFYDFTNLTPGDYSVKVEAPSFAAGEIKNLTLEVGKALTENVQLTVAKAGEVVTVNANQVAVELTQSEVQGQITGTTMQNIPLNGRNYLELAYLLPGNRPATNYDPTKTDTLEVSSAGNFGRGGNITVDGGDNNDEVVGGTLANFPEDGIAEFQIATNRYTAEVGRSGSSIINIITKSGTNDLHGSAFFFFRHRDLQGLPFTFNRNQPTPRFDREQFGGSMGGAIKKDKAWWFLSVEDRSQRNGVQVAQRDTATDTIVQTSAPGNLQDLLTTSRVDYKATDRDNLAARYSFNRNSSIDAASLRKPIGTAEQRQDSFNHYHSWLGSWNHVFSSHQINELIYHMDFFINKIPAFGGSPETDPAGLAPGNEVRFPDIQDGESFRIPQRTRLNRYQIKDNYSWVLGKHTVKFGGEWENYGSDIQFDLFGSGRIDVTENFATQDRNGDGVINDLDIPVAVTLRNTAHACPVTPVPCTASAGAVPHAPFYRDNYFGFYVQDDWKVRSNLTLNLGLRWEYDTDVLGDGNFSKPCADPTVVTGGSLPANAGCLWVKNAVGGHDGPPTKNFGPRVGFAWDPLGRGKTVVRGGYGIYYDRVVLEVPLLEVLLDGRVLGLSLTNGSTLDAAGNFIPDPVTGNIVNLANPFAGGPISGVGIGINSIDRHARSPLYQQFTFGVQQQAGKNWVFSADGVHNYGYGLLIGRFLRAGTTLDPRVPLVCTDNIKPCTVTDPATGISDNITNIESSAKFWYDGLLTSVKKRPTSLGPVKWSANISYTLSKTFNYSNDDQIPFNGAEDAANLVLGVNDIRLEKGYAPTDERHRFVFNGVFDFPWQISAAPIWTWSSSVPIDSFVPALGSRIPTIARNALARQIQNGAELNAAIDQCNAEGFCPGLGHVDPNMHFGDDFNSFDMRLTKTVNLFGGERQQLQFIGEVFNLFNVTNIRGFNNNNYSGFANSLVNSATNPALIDPTFNTPIRTAGGFFGSGGPRAFQLAAKYTF